MYTFDEKKINELSENGFYDFIIDEEEEGNLTADDKEDIYQYCLVYLQEHLDEKAAHEFLTGLNNVLLDKKACGCFYTLVLVQSLRQLYVVNPAILL